MDHDTLIGRVLKNTPCLGIIDKDTQTLHYSMAAQYLPVLLRSADGASTSLLQEAKPLGLFPNVSYGSDQVDFPQGTLFVFSMGQWTACPRRSLKTKSWSFRCWSKHCQSPRNFGVVCANR